MVLLLLCIGDTVSLSAANEGGFRYRYRLNERIWLILKHKYFLLVDSYWRCCCWRYCYCCCFCCLWYLVLLTQSGLRVAYTHWYTHTHSLINELTNSLKSSLNSDFRLAVVATFLHFLPPKRFRFWTIVATVAAAVFAADFQIPNDLLRFFPLMLFVSMCVNK